MPKNPNINQGGRPPASPILRAEIEEAQRNTKSNAGAARYLGVDYRVYKRYAKLYGLFERHLNPEGIGIDKGFSKSPRATPLKEILENKHPDYSRAKLKNRLIARDKIKEVCSLCGFSERRVTDNTVPLMLSHKDGDSTNFNLDNLELLCYNCMYLTTGAPSVAYRKDIETSFDKPEKLSKETTLEPTMADAYPAQEEQEKLDKFYNNERLTMTDEEREQLLKEIEQELEN